MLKVSCLSCLVKHVRETGFYNTSKEAYAFATENYFRGCSGFNSIS